MSTHDKNQPAPLWVVDAPAGYANAELNGARAITLNPVAVGVVNVLIVSGPRAGSRWQLLAKHLKEITHEPR